MPIKVNGLTSGSVTLAAPDTGSDVTVSLPGVSGELLPLAGGKIMQIVRATDGTARSTTSTSLVDASISVTITPQKSDSAILIIALNTTRVLFQGAPAGGSRVQRGVLSITDASNNAISGAETNRFGLVSVDAQTAPAFWSNNFLLAYATPATTSATTYKLRFSVDNASDTLEILNATATTGQMYAIEVSA
jgi:hypothetical protein